MDGQHFILYFFGKHFFEKSYIKIIIYFYDLESEKIALVWSVARTKDGGMKHLQNSYIYHLHLPARSKNFGSRLLQN